MKKEIEITVDYEKVITSKKELDLPEVSKYYLMNDDGRFFPRGVVLFAIIPNYDNNPSYSYTLIEVERNKQNYDDFVPTKDCRQKEWLKESGLRKTAFNIITKQSCEFKEISEKEFKVKRIELLNNYLTNK